APRIRLSPSKAFTSRMTSARFSVAVEPAGVEPTIAPARQDATRIRRRFDRLMAGSWPRRTVLESRRPPDAGFRDFQCLDAAQLARPLAGPVVFDDDVPAAACLPA